MPRTRLRKGVKGWGGLFHTVDTPCHKSQQKRSRSREHAWSREPPQLKKSKVKSPRTEHKGRDSRCKDKSLPHAQAELAAGQWQVRLVHLVDLNVADLVEAHDADVHQQRWSQCLQRTKDNACRQLVKTVQRHERHSRNADLPNIERGRQLLVTRQPRLHRALLSPRWCVAA